MYSVNVGKIDSSLLIYVMNAIQNNLLKKKSVVTCPHLQPFIH